MRHSDGSFGRFILRWQKRLFHLMIPAVWAARVVMAQEHPVTSVQQPPIQVPAGFQVQHFADDDLAHDIQSMTLNAKGQVVVSGPGYVRTLIDSNQDGIAESYETFAEAPATGAQGMYFMGAHLLCSGDEGLQIFRDEDGDGKADGPATTFLKVKAGREHDVHAIRKGPDGWWYIIAGNMAGVTGAYATLPTSPLKHPEGGVLMRLKPDLSGGEIVADGFRNAYDFAFSEAGDVFTFDSDGERDVSLPWYQPCRILQVLPGSHAGWVSRSWKRPGHFPDMPPVIAEFGRGSPTGVVCYRHDQFPSRYNGAIFALDWTFGRILVLSLQEERGAWKAEGNLFAKASGEFGFAPTDMVVAPDGSLLVSVGGRGSRGSVYRISYSANMNNPLPPAPENKDEESRLAFVLNAKQPQSSWSRAQWYPVAQQLGKAAFASAATDEGRRPLERVRAIEVLTDVFDGLDPATARLLTAARSVPVRARTAWSLGRSNPASPLKSDLMTLLNDRDPLVARCALEVLTTVQSTELLDACLPRLAVCLGADDLAVRSAAARVISRLSSEQQHQLSLLLDANLRSSVWLAMGQVFRNRDFHAQALQVALKLLGDSTSSIEGRQDAVRLLQLSLGDVGPGKGVPQMLESYTPRANLKPHMAEVKQIREIIEEQFPSGFEQYDRELLRTLAMVGSTNRAMLPKLLNGITQESSPADDIHCLAAVSRIVCSRTSAETQATAQALVNLDIKIRLQNMKQDSNWDDRVSELYQALCEANSEIPQVIGSLQGFGQPGHVLFLKNIPEEHVQTAIDGFAKYAAKDESYAWTTDVVFVIGRSTRAAHAPLIRQQLENLGVQDAVLIVLARDPDPEDRSAFLEGLNAVQPKVVAACVDALTKLPRNNSPAEQYTLLNALRRLQNSEEEFQLREKVFRLLENNLALTVPFVFGKQGHTKQPEAVASIEAALQARFPGFVPQRDHGDVAAAIMAALPDVDWAAGDPVRGARVFERFACAKCHDGRTALGPNLEGVAKRFSREDLFAAIVYPDRDVSDRYQLTTVETRSGKMFSGLVVYDSVDTIMLRDSEHHTHRIAAEDVESKVRQRKSLMPANLLKDVTIAQLADLDAYLRSSEPPPEHGPTP